VPAPFHQLPVLAAHRAQLIDRKTSSIDLPFRDEIFGPDLIAIRPIPLLQLDCCQFESLDPACTFSSGGPAPPHQQ
jgi:hypothetical protein